MTNLNKTRAAEKVCLQSRDGDDSFKNFKRFQYKYIDICNQAKCDFYSHNLKINDSKTEFILIGTQKQLERCQIYK